MEEFLLRASPLTFRNVGGHGDRRPPELCCHAVDLFARKLGGRPVDRLDKVHRLLPGDQITVVPTRHCIPLTLLPLPRPTAHCPLPTIHRPLPAVPTDRPFLA